MDHAEFQQIKAELTEQLAQAIGATLVEMGDDVKGISWFSSSAAEHPKNVVE